MAAKQWRPPGQGPTGLYVHVPFCPRKCGYCSFYSLGRAAGLDAPEARSYLDAVAVELRSLPTTFRPQTVFVGGGTPTELCARDLERLLELVRERMWPQGLVEWTCEANPGTLGVEKARLLRQAGVTRVSVGVQSFDERILRFLGRSHTPAESMSGLELLREEGIHNLNVDLILGVPESPATRLSSDLAATLQFQPEHISCYCLSFDNGTPLHSRRAAGVVQEMPDEDQKAEYEYVRAVLGAEEYLHYEISNYCRADAARDLRCCHNLLYWGPGQYYGVGPAAHSHVHGERYGNVRSVERYCSALVGAEGCARGRQGAPRGFSERLSPRAWAREALVMGLRRTEGVSYREFLRQTGFAVEAVAGESVGRFLHLGLLEATEGGGIRLTPEAYFVSDSVFAELV
ncbi:radical SAM family heme chaperone HemW [Planctomycetota bacterium]